ncbi:MAG: T9SS type A sorting domain-containing protein [Bacteroidales bacterium]|nr:T9SS type A sorting domain-containing protein [Bacteroidales bacterium]
MKHFSIWVLLWLISIVSLNAQNFSSVVQEQNAYYKSLNISDQAYYSINKPAEMHADKSIQSCNLNKMVFGWHPYWQNGYEANYDWNLISDFCYFSYELNASTGQADDTHSFATTSVVTEALSSGTNVHLCVTLFSNHSTFLGNATAKQTLINNLISLISNRGAHGVNIDFEAVSSTQKDPLTAFMIDLSNQMHSAIPGSKVSIDLPAVDWNATFDVNAMAPYVDYFMIMGYDYYWGGSEDAGPHSPLYTFSSGYDYNLSKSISYYTHAGAPEEQLVMGVPYYGREWATASSSIPSSTTATGSTITYKTLKNNSSGHYNNRQWDSNSCTPYYVYNDGEWNQCFCDDNESLRLRYDFVRYRSLAGIGIWALGYDDGYTELWQAIADELTTCYQIACSDTLYDLGGPNHNYYNYEDYTYTISPPNAIAVQLNFLEFQLENGWDTLWIYDGADVNAPQIGNYTGSNSPGSVVSSSGAITIRFHSDVSTNATGYKAVWQCITDQTLPTTEVIENTDWHSDDFSVSFIDNDNFAVDQAFYSLVQYDGANWQSNTNNGFLNETFSNANLSTWSINAGTWSVGNNSLQQSDESNSNTNAYISLNQNNNQSYLYTWRMKIGGTGANRRAGLYIFSDDASQTQRNNAYMVYFRVDQNKCQIYKSEANSIYIQTDDTCVVNADEWYDYKVLFNPQTGLIQAYQNDELVSQWLDSSPHTSGQYLSLRTGECLVQYDDFRVYKSRSDQVDVAIGNEISDDVQIQNLNPSTPSAWVYSIVKDINENFSLEDSAAFNVDWSIPLATTGVIDGFVSDIDTLFDNTAFQGEWTAGEDPNSGIIKYYYAIGTYAGVSDIVDWTDNADLLYCDITVAFDWGLTYYLSVKTENGAGLISDVFSSDGFLVYDLNSVVGEIEIDNLTIYPNPASNNVTVYSIFEFNIHKTNIKILNLKGQLVKSYLIDENDKTLMIDISDLEEGLYILELGNYKKAFVKN